MKFTAFLSVAFLLVVLGEELFSQDTIPYPSMSEVLPSVKAGVERAGEDYQYSYIVSNGESAPQQIRRFMVQLKSTSANSVAPLSWRASRAIRVGIVAATWHSLDSTKDIFPDTLLSGFQILSTGLPTIVQFYALGRIPLPHGEFIPQPGTADIFSNSAQGRTISPADPPAPFNGLTFLDTITSYISESRTLGWITNDPTANKYKRLIDTARFHLQANNRGVTKAKLDSVLVNVYPDSAAGLITSEAYALLRFNTEYVLKKLSEE